MPRVLRLLRGAIGMGVTWALGWFAAGMGVRLVIGPGVGDVPMPIVFAMFGFVSGVTFSGFLTLTAGRRRFDEMSLGRFAGWGAAGGALLSGILVATAGPAGQSLLILPALALAGAVSAAGTLSLARKAETPRLLDNGMEDASDSAPGRFERPVV